MSSSLGRISARLAEPTDSLPPEMVALINRNIKPPTPVTAEEIHVRAMYIVSDQVNSFGGRFPIDEHQHLTELLIDSPVLVGHRKDRLPVGRNFHAELVERDGHPWVKCYFYWLRSSDTAEQLRDNIDGGIYKECSIAFTFNLPACSICGKDIRRCEHEPFETYEHEGTEKNKRACHFDYREIEKVLETSLVYRGAVPETAITRKLETAVNQPRPVPLDSIDQLDQNGSFLIVPRYDGLPLTACRRDGALSLAGLDGNQVAANLSENGRPSAFRSTVPMYGMLVGYRGRERCSRQQLDRYLKDRTGPVSRLILNVYPHQGLLTLPKADAASRLQIRIVPYRVVSPTTLEPGAREIMTRDGVEIWPLSSTSLLAPTNDVQAWAYHPTKASTTTEPGYRLEAIPNSSNAILTISEGHSAGRSRQVFEIVNCDLDLLRTGRRFVARPTTPTRRTDKPRPAVLLEGNVSSIENSEGSLVVKSTGDSAGELTLRSIRLDGHGLFMFSVSPRRFRG